MSAIIIPRVDNVIRLPRNPSGTGWPTCYVCYQPVEAYRLVDETIDHQTVEASCSHKSNKVFTDVKTVTMRRRWTSDRRANELCKLMFFVPDVSIPNTTPAPI